MRWPIENDEVKSPQWRAFFAFIPVEVESKWVWMEDVERRWSPEKNDYEYRLPQV